MESPYPFTVGTHPQPTNVVFDPVNFPAHYNMGKIGCIDAIREALGKEQFIGYLRGSAMKYIWRAPHKENFIQDIEKAIWFLERLLEELKNDR